MQNLGIDNYKMTTKTYSLSQLALQKFKKNFWGVFSLCFVALVGLVSVFAYLFAPDNSQNANQMHVSIHSKPPGFNVKMLTIPSQIKNEQSLFQKVFFGINNTDSEIPISSYSIHNNQLTYTEFASDGLEGDTKTIDASYITQNSASQYIKNVTFHLGTDKYGRDLLSRLLVGARISFFIGFVAVFISLVIGIFMGSVAGYYGGKVDALIMWIINVTWSIPTLLLVIAITLALGKGFWQVFIAVGLTMWVEVARVVRGQLISAKQMQYVTAARALGFNDFRIITKHILPNIMAPVIVICAANFAAAILIESGLSFLGIGAQPPMASWGAMIKDHYNYIILGKPYLAILPGLCIMLLVMAFMLIGNALRDALDVKV
ncbi:peptide/nickel transport system permease protein [Olleya sp. Hel_I_94]|nr:peptide/nickel transport system permease protein [Olleya sp. Hel_I_94]